MSEHHINRQNVFNRVVTHLRAQGNRAIDPAGGCMYRAKDGKKCAIGALFPDEVYDPRMDAGCIGVRMLLEHWPAVIPHVTGLPEGVMPGIGDMTFLSDIQAMHDDAGGRDNFDFDSIAAEYNLEVS